MGSMSTMWIQSGKWTTKHWSTVNNFLFWGCLSNFVGKMRDRGAVKLLYATGPGNYSPVLLRHYIGALELSVSGWLS